MAKGRFMSIRLASRAFVIAVLLVSLGFVGGHAGAQSSAQSTAAPVPPPDQNVVFVRTGMGPLGPGDAMDFVGFEAGLGGKRVTGAPFTATITVKRTQTLADGNQIDRSTSGTIARDTQGRVRREMTLPAIGAYATSSQGAPHVIFINDVVSGMQYILDPNRKIAHQVRLELRPRFNRAGMRRNRADTSQQGAGDVATTSLGTQTINGVQAQGTRYTRTIPAGQIGNEKPIVITTERWYSPQLQTYVMTKTTDPIRGDSVRELTNIRLGEPAASLFQVPPGYTIEKGPVVRIRRRRRIGAGAPPPPPPDGGPDQARQP